jgi:hypothetical protein
MQPMDDVGSPIDRRAMESGITKSTKVTEQNQDFYLCVLRDLCGSRLMVAS